MCIHCKENGVCDGGYIPVYPKKGYWRVDKSSKKFYKCETFQSACLGNDTCSIEYSGVLCGSCNFGD